jgi:methylmalonyl-CoA mutase C-terminal domain/subunit
MELLGHKGVDDILVIGGGIIPEEDIPQLKECGIAEIFGPGTSTGDIVNYIKADGDNGIHNAIGHPCKKILKKKI